MNIGEKVDRGGNADAWNMEDVGKFAGGEANADTSEKRSELVGEKETKSAEQARAEVLESFKVKQPEAMQEITAQPIVENVSLKPQKTTGAKVKEVLAKTAKTVGGGSLMLAGCVATVAFPPLAPAFLGAAFVGLSVAQYQICGINNSMFEVHAGNRIYQAVNLPMVLARYRGKKAEKVQDAKTGEMRNLTSDEIFKRETHKLFEGLKPGKTYETRSHIGTLMLLQKEGKGYIENLTKTPARPSRLIFERLMTGALKRDYQAAKEYKLKHPDQKVSVLGRTLKKREMYNIKFTKI